MHVSAHEEDDGKEDSRQLARIFKTPENRSLAQDVTVPFQGQILWRSARICAEAGLAAPKEPKLRYAVQPSNWLRSVLVNVWRHLI